MPRLILAVLAALVMVAGAAAGATAQSSDDSDRDRSDAGRIASFSGDILTIETRGGDAVSGRVTRGTEIECERDDDDRGRGRATTTTAATASVSAAATTTQRRPGPWRRRRSRGRDDADDRPCSRADLTAGARVRKADLRLGRRGATWDEIELAG